MKRTPATYTYTNGNDRYYSDEERDRAAEHFVREDDYYPEDDPDARRAVEGDVNKYLKNYVKDEDDLYEDVEQETFFSKAVKVVSTTKFYAQIKSWCNVVSIASGTFVPPCVYLGTSDGFIGIFTMPQIYCLYSNIPSQVQSI